MIMLSNKSFMTPSNHPFVGLRKHRINQFPCRTGGNNAYEAVGDLSGKIYTVIHARRVLLLLYFNFILLSYAFVVVVVMISYQVFINLRTEVNT